MSRQWLSTQLSSKKYQDSPTLLGIQHERRPAAARLQQEIQPGSRTPVSGLGDFTLYWFEGTCVPEERVGTTAERLSTWEFSVKLKVTRTLMHSGGWRDAPEEARLSQFFEFVREELTRRGSPSRGETVELELSTWTQDRRFEGGPAYTTDSIQPEEPFRLKRSLGTTPDSVAAPPGAGAP